MDCCQCDLIERHFDRETVAKKVERYRTQGLKKETEILVDALLAEGVEGRSLLDVGGGLGALEFELLKAGSSQVTNVEASSAYIEAAKAESSRQGFSGRVSHIHGDFVAIDGIPTERFLALWKEKVFELLIREEKITPELANDMGRWKHSGFSMDHSVFVPKGDDLGMQPAGP